MTYQVVEQSGYADERLIAEFDTSYEAESFCKAQYEAHEWDELNVRILKDWSAEY